MIRPSLMADIDEDRGPIHSFERAGIPDGAQTGVVERDTNDYLRNRCGGLSYKNIQGEKDARSHSLLSRCDEQSDGWRVFGPRLEGSQDTILGDARLIRKTMHLPPAEQKRDIEAAGLTPIISYN